MPLKDRVKWYALASGCVFLALSTYVKYVKVVFYYAEEANGYMRSALLAAIATLVLGLMSLPRWQSFFALAVVVYALYWFSRPAYAIP